MRCQKGDDAASAIAMKRDKSPFAVNTIATIAYTLHLEQTERQHQRI